MTPSSRLVQEAVPLEAKTARLQGDLDHYRSINRAEIAGAVDFLDGKPITCFGVVRCHS